MPFVTSHGADKANKNSKGGFFWYTIMIISTMFTTTNVPGLRGGAVGSYDWNQEELISLDWLVSVT